MQVNINTILKNFEVVRSKLDRTDRAHTIKNCITLLTTEILRISKMPYSSWQNLDKLRSLDKQIEYLESILAAYESDLKSHE